MNLQIVAVTCLFLAGKVEESPRRLQDIVEVYYYNAGRPKGDLQTVQVQSVSASEGFILIET
jgi:hypothetical protein